MPFLKKLTFLWALFSLCVANAFIHKQFYTLSPYIEAAGPTMLNFYDRQDYNDEVFPIILERAHLKARAYLEMQDVDAYWSFLLLGLTVPSHESFNVHFRKIQSTHDCFEYSNSGDILKHAPDTRELFFKTLKQTDPPQVPGCRLLDPTAEHLQIIHASDGSDIGVMQVSIYWHYDKYLAKDKHLDIRQSLDYGLDLLKTSFDYVYRRIEDYPCLSEDKSPSRAANYINLIKGSWAGYYNSGKFQNTCRFKDPNDPWAKNDLAFKNSLTNILNYEPSRQADHSGLKLSKKHAEILKKVVQSFKDSSDNNKFLIDYLNDQSKGPKNMRIDMTPQLSTAQKRGVILTRLKVRTNSPKDGRLAPFSGLVLPPKTRVIIDKKYQLPNGDHWYQLSSPIKGWVSGNPRFIDILEQS